MKLIVALLLVLSGAAATVRPTTNPQRQPAATPVTDAEFAYLLVHAKIEAESPLPHILPPGSRSHYRILGYTQQGNCVDGCPPSTIYVALWNYHDYHDGRIRAFRIEGLRFYDFVGVKSYKPTVRTGTFLTFHVYSRPQSDKRELYEVSVSQDRCSIKKLSE